MISALLREAFNIDDLKLSREKRSRVDGPSGDDEETIAGAKVSRDEAAIGREEEDGRPEAELGAS
jgi:hypothetical protein